MPKLKSVADYPAKTYFMPDELETLLGKMKMYVNLTVAERQKYFRNTVEHNMKALELQKRIDHYQRIVDKLEELANAPSDH